MVTNKHHEISAIICKFAETLNESVATLWMGLSAITKAKELGHSNNAEIVVHMSTEHYPCNWTNLKELLAPFGVEFTVVRANWKNFGSWVIVTKI